jgi:2Fe-2S ferredoxin
VVHSTKRLTIVRNNTEIKFFKTTNVLELLNANNIGINQSCGGSGICTTCRIIVLEGADSFSKMEDLEKETSIEKKFNSQERLACQAEILDSAVIEIPENNL